MYISIYILKTTNILSIGYIVAMLNLYVQSVKYIEQEARLLGAQHPGIVASITARLKHLHEQIASQDVGEVDAHDLMEELNKECSCFSQQQRAALGDTLSLRVRNPSASTRDYEAAAHQHNAQLLEPAHVGYIPLERKSWNLMLEEAASFLVEVLGLRSPNDEAVKNILATILIAQGKELDPDSAYDEFHGFRGKVANKRDLLPAPKHYMEYPLDPQEFCRAHPQAYPAEGPPIESLIAFAQIRDRMRRDVMPTRSTNRRLTSKRGTTPQKAQQTKADKSSDSFAETLVHFLLQGRVPENPSRRADDTPREPLPLSLEGIRPSEKPLPLSAEAFRPGSAEAFRIGSADKSPSSLSMTDASLFSPSWPAALNDLGKRLLEGASCTALAADAQRIPENASSSSWAGPAQVVRVDGSEKKVETPSAGAVAAPAVASIVGIIAEAKEVLERNKRSGQGPKKKPSAAAAKKKKKTNDSDESSEEEEPSSRRRAWSLGCSARAAPTCSCDWGGCAMPTGKTMHYHGGRITFARANLCFRAFRRKADTSAKQVKWPRKDGQTADDCIKSLQQWIDEGLG